VKSVEHRPYPKIPRDRDGSLEAPAGLWVATEKIHGGHLVVATDGGACAIGKRKQWLAPDEPFFGWQLLRSDLTAAARGVFEALGAEGVVRLHGEIFGGAYPHSEVESLAGMTPVQTGIWYAPDIRFALFDIVVEAGGAPRFLSHSEVVALAGAHGLFVVPLLGRGPRAELERLPVRFPSRVATLLGLPPIADNVAEGFVLKPDMTVPVSERYVTKWKLPDFDDVRFNEAEPFAPDALLDAAALGRIVASLVNPARLASARAKTGPVPDAMCEEAVLDALVDLEEAFPRAFAALTGDELEVLRARASELAGALARGE
jgi:Rnl2 family RNA ligase